MSLPSQTFSSNRSACSASKTAALSAAHRGAQGRAGGPAALSSFDISVKVSTRRDLRLPTRPFTRTAPRACRIGRCAAAVSPRCVSHPMSSDSAAGVAIAASVRTDCSRAAAAAAAASHAFCDVPPMGELHRLHAFRQLADMKWALRTHSPLAAQSAHSFGFTSSHGGEGGEWDGGEEGGECSEGEALGGSDAGGRKDGG